VNLNRGDLEAPEMQNFACECFSKVKFLLHYGKSKIWSSTNSFCGSDLAGKKIGVGQLTFQIRGTNKERAKGKFSRLKSNFLVKVL